MTIEIKDNKIKIGNLEWFPKRNFLSTDFNITISPELIESKKSDSSRRQPDYNYRSYLNWFNMYYDEININENIFEFVALISNNNTNNLNKLNIQKEMIDQRYQEFINYENLLKENFSKNILIDTVQSNSKNHLQFYNKLANIVESVDFSEFNYGDEVIRFFRGEKSSNIGKTLYWANKDLDIDYSLEDYGSLKKSYNYLDILKEDFYDFNLYINNEKNQEKFITNDLLIDQTLSPRESKNKNYIFDTVSIVSQSLINVSRALFLPVHTSALINDDLQIKNLNYLNNLDRTKNNSRLYNLPTIKNQKIADSIYSDTDGSFIIDNLSNKVNFKNASLSPNYNYIDNTKFTIDNSAAGNWVYNETRYKENITGMYFRKFFTDEKLITKFGSNRKPGAIAEARNEPVRFSYIDKSGVKRTFNNETLDNINEMNSFYDIVKISQQFSFDNFFDTFDLNKMYIMISNLLNNIKLKKIEKEGLNIDYMINFLKRSIQTKSPLVFGNSNDNCVINTNTGEDNIFYSNSTYLNSFSNKIKIDENIIRSSLESLDNPTDSSFLREFNNNLETLLESYYPDNLFKNNFEFFKKIFMDFSRADFVDYIKNNFSYNKDFLYPKIILEKNETSKNIANVFFAKSLSSILGIDIDEKIFDDPDFDISIVYSGQESDILKVSSNYIVLNDIFDVPPQEGNLDHIVLNLNITPAGSFQTISSIKDGYASLNTTSPSGFIASFDSLINGDNLPQANVTLEEVKEKGVNFYAQSGDISQEEILLIEDSVFQYSRSTLAEAAAERAAEEDRRFNQESAAHFAATSTPLIREAWDSFSRNQERREREQLADEAEIETLVNDYRYQLYTSEINNNRAERIDAVRSNILLDRPIDRIENATGLDINGDGFGGVSIRESFTVTAEDLGLFTDVSGFFPSLPSKKNKTEIIPADFNARINGFIFSAYDKENKVLFSSDNQIKAENDDLIDIDFYTLESDVRSDYKDFVYNENKNVYLYSLYNNENIIRNQVFLTKDQSIFDFKIQTIKFILKYVLKEGEIDSVTSQDEIIGFIKNNEEVSLLIKDLLSLYNVIFKYFTDKSFYTAAFEVILSETFATENTINLMKEKLSVFTQNFVKFHMILNSKHIKQFLEIIFNADYFKRFKLFEKENLKEVLSANDIATFEYITTKNEFLIIKLFNMLKRSDLTQSANFDLLHGYLKDTLLINEKARKINQKININLSEINNDSIQGIDIRKFALNDKETNYTLRQYYESSIIHSALNQEISKKKELQALDSLNFSNDVLKEYKDKEVQYISSLLSNDSEKDVLCVAIPNNKLDNVNLDTIYKISINVSDHTRPDLYCHNRDYYFSPLFSANTKLIPELLLNKDNVPEVEFNNRQERILFFNPNTNQIKNRISLVTEADLIKIVTPILTSINSNFYNNDTIDKIGKQMFQNYIKSGKLETILSEVSNFPSKDKCFSSSVYDQEIIGNNLRNFLSSIRSDKFLNLFQEDVITYSANTPQITSSISENLFEYEEFETNTKVYSFTKNLDRIYNNSDLRESFEEKEYYDLYFIEISPSDFLFLDKYADAGKAGLNSVNESNTKYSKFSVPDNNTDFYDYNIKNPKVASGIKKERNQPFLKNNYNYIIKVEEL